MKIEATPMANQRPIRPLFILGNPRTGSTLLSTLLLQHPSIHVHGELFHSVENERKESHKLRGRRKTWFDPEVDDAIIFLDEHVFGVSTDYQDTEVSIVGVKIFADHVSEGGATHLFRRIRAHYPQAEIIHMRRDDYLDVLISHEFASRSGQWVSWSHDSKTRDEIPPFEIDLENARDFWERMYRADSFFALSFSGDKYFPIHYSQLSSNIPSASADLFSRLNVEPHEVTGATEKQVNGDDLDLILNLDVLMQEYSAFRRDLEI